MGRCGHGVRETTPLRCHVRARGRLRPRQIRARPSIIEPRNGSRTRWTGGQRRTLTTTRGGRSRRAVQMRLLRDKPVRWRLCFATATPGFRERDQWLGGSYLRAHTWARKSFRSQGACSAPAQGATRCEVPLTHGGSRCAEGAGRAQGRVVGHNPSEGSIPAGQPYRY